MATINLSGNFQPLNSLSGKPLPQPETGEQKPRVSEGTKPSVDPTNVDTRVQENIAQQKEEQQKQSEDVQAQIREISSISQNIARRLLFKVDNDTGDTVVSVIDRDTDKLIRQIPPEELLTLSKRLKALNEESSEAAGIFVQKQV